jgi:eukaryotic-like serine/threonine-protein kinase
MDRAGSHSLSVSGVKEGDVLAGKYRIERTLGAGGMGVVVQAHHLQLDERVAIKFLLPEALAHREAVARFTREAQAAVKIKSEHVARVLDVGTLDNGAPYTVMEYLEGRDLCAWLAQNGPLPIEQAVEFLLQACEAIAEAHGLGIVHRDLKPANLFCIRRPDGVLSVKVLDFGISKLMSGQALDMTKTDTTIGSPVYMSPEQLQSSRDVDARTDIWSLGVILYELLAGSLPFGADSLPELCMKLAMTVPPPLRTKRPDVQAALEQVISRCLEKNRKDRYANVGQLAVDLGPFAPARARASVERIQGVMQSAGLSASSVSLASESDSTPRMAPTQTVAAWGQTAGSSQQRHGKRLLVGAAAGLAVATVGIVLGAVSMRTRAPSPRDSSQPATDVSSAANRAILAARSSPAAERGTGEVPTPVAAASEESRPGAVPPASAVPEDASDSSRNTRKSSNTGTGRPGRPEPVKLPVSSVSKARTSFDQP